MAHNSGLKLFLMESHNHRLQLEQALVSVQRDTNYARAQIQIVKLAQINYVSRNQLHCTENLNFGLMYKKAKHCRALPTNFLFLFQLTFFLIKLKEIGQEASRNELKIP